MSVRVCLIAIAACVLSACGSSTQFVSTWKSPEAGPLGLQDRRVVAVVMARDPSMRRQAEDVLAGEISRRGARGVPMYSLLEEANPGNEDEARKVLDEANIAGAIVMRPVGTDKELVAVPGNYYGTPVYSGFYGGYYAHGWASPWDYEVYTNTIVSVETLVYSLDQNRLVWAGQSKTTNPEKVDDFVRELAGEVAEQLQNEGLVAGG